MKVGELYRYQPNKNQSHNGGGFISGLNDGDESLRGIIVKISQVRESTCLGFFLRDGEHSRHWSFHMTALVLMNMGGKGKSYISRRPKNKPRKP